MTAYAIAHVHSVDVGPEIIEYLEKIDATLEPFGARFLAHAGAFEKVEGSWGLGVILIEFPSTQAAHRWYDSQPYQEILPLRTENMVADIILAEGVADGYLASSTARKMAA